jgi:hypothetical protein
MVSTSLPRLQCAKTIIEHDNNEHEEVSIKNVTQTQSGSGDLGSLGDHRNYDGHSIDNGQTRSYLPQLLALENAASATEISDQPANLSISPAADRQGGAHPLEYIPAIFLSHVIMSIAVGVLLNIETGAVFAAPGIMGAIVFSAFASYLFDFIGAIRLLSTALKTNTLNRYKDSARTADGVELATIENESASWSNRAARSTSSADETSQISDAMVEGPVTSAAPEENQDMNTTTQTDGPPAPHTDMVDQTSQLKIDDDGRLVVSRHRQDTEAGLRHQ